MATGGPSRPSSSRGSKEFLKSRIQRFHDQLTKGCGQESCDNPDCATGSKKPLKATEAAVKAVKLAKQGKAARLCVDVKCVSSSGEDMRVSSKKSFTSTESVSSGNVKSGDIEPMDTTNSTGEDSSLGVEPSSSTDSAASSTLILVTSHMDTTGESSRSKTSVLSGARGTKGAAVSSGKGKVKGRKELPHIATPFLTEERVVELMARKDGDYKELTNELWLVFSSPSTLNCSFLLPEDGRPDVCLETGISVDVTSVRNVYTMLFSPEVKSISNALVNAMDMYGNELQRNKLLRIEQPLNHCAILLENPLLHSPEFIKAFPKLLRGIASLPVERKVSLVQWYSHYDVKELNRLLSSLQQLITLQLLFSDDSDHFQMYIPQTDAAVTAATTVMTIVFFASLVKAKREGQVRPLSESLSSVAAQQEPEFLRGDYMEYEQLLFRLKVHPATVLSPALPVRDFENEELNSRVNMSVDYQRFAGNSANKVERILRDNVVRQYHERHRTIMHAVLTGVPDIPFLLLRVDRNSIVSDALVQLEAISEMNPIDLRKQLRVEFNGEEGIDEGGIQKEFFQLIVEQLFDPMYGMFVFDEDAQQHWFNPMSYETKHEYRLIGLLLGLAIYNNIILDIRFPMVVYHKLIGCQTVFQDLYSYSSQIARSLQSMLDHTEEDGDFEETYMATFQVSYADMFGHLHTHDLRENGDSIPVTMDNRQEYVDLYADWLLNKSISDQFTAFKAGFDVVMGSSCLADLFRAEEVELLVCGSNDWNLDVLEDSTRYDGFTSRHPVIVNFWEIVRGFSDTQKKQLLAFVTGSDRIPLGGLAKLKFIIVKNGPDSDRLPTAHTCFNALLLCEYSSKEKLRERLTKAISYAKGFGMI